MIHPIVSPRAQVRMMGLRSSRVESTESLKPSHPSGALPSVHPPLRKGVWCCNRIANPTKYHQEGFNRGAFAVGLSSRGECFEKKSANGAFMIIVC